MSKKLRSEIREEMKKVLASLDRRWLDAASSELGERLSHLIDQELGRETEHVLAWTSFFPGEVDLTRFIGEQLGKRRVYLPRILPDKSMTFIAVGQDWAMHVERDSLGIPAPPESAGELYDTRWAGSTAVIVPGLAFDRLGNRLGRGKGYYDRFLARANFHLAVKIGVAWTLQIISKVPFMSHDVAMDWMCSEQSYARCSSSQALV